MGRESRPPPSTKNPQRITSVLATSATGPHPFPSRTRSLSLSAPMVLRSRGRGRVGRRQRPLQMSNVQYRMSNFEIRYLIFDILNLLLVLMTIYASIDT